VCPPSSPLSLGCWAWESPNCSASPICARQRPTIGCFAAIPALHRELTAYLLEPDEGVWPRPVSELAKAVAAASRLRHAVDLDHLGAELPGLLAGLRAAWPHTAGSQRKRVFGLLAETYYAAGQLAWKLGDTDLASISVDRYEWVAERSGDELAVLVGVYRRAGELICLDDRATAARLVDDARCRIENRLGRSAAPTLAIWGNLHLKSGLAAARAGDRVRADAHLAEARQTAARIGADRDDYRLCFGPTNVNIWAVGLAVEMMDGTEAITRASTFTLPRSAPRERVGHHWIDLARGYLLHGDHPRALATLQQARRTTPQQTRYHPQVHETVRALARASKRRTDTLTNFAGWLGITT
jgi:tetratricopeptide (TPR) repeat protein